MVEVIVPAVLLVVNVVMLGVAVRAGVDTRRSRREAEHVLAQLRRRYPDA